MLQVCVYRFVTHFLQKHRNREQMIKNLKELMQKKLRFWLNFIDIVKQNRYT